MGKLQPMKPTILMQSANGTHARGFCFSDSLEEEASFVWDGSHLLQEIQPDGRYTYIYTNLHSYDPLAQVRDWTTEDGEGVQQAHYFHYDPGVHYNFFSYYDPDAGRFMNQDPIGVEGGFNFYRFAPNAQEWVDIWEPAIESCQILSDYNIDINDPANGIAVGHPRPHNEMHNRKFHEKVRDRLKNVILKELAG